MPALEAAWFANMVFAVLAIVAIVRMQRQV
jgi:hypothetical protein